MRWSYGDLLMRCLYRVRPYEKEKGFADALAAKWRDICVDSVVEKHPSRSFRQICQELVEDFDALPIDETLVKPRVGVVGEILVKYMPVANNHLVELLEREGAEAVVPGPDGLLQLQFLWRDLQAPVSGAQVDLVRRGAGGGERYPHGRAARPSRRCAGANALSRPCPSSRLPRWPSLSSHRATSTGRGGSWPARWPSC